MKKINFTKEHEKEFKDLALELLLKGTFLRGMVGTEYSVFDILHAVTINTVNTMYTNLKKEIEKLEGVSEWDMTEYQQRKLSETKKMYKFLNLAIGWRKYQEQKAELAKRERELKKEIEALELDSLTPEQRIQAKRKELDDLMGVEPVDIGEDKKEEEKEEKTDTASEK